MVVDIVVFKAEIFCNDAFVSNPLIYSPAETSKMCYQVSKRVRSQVGILSWSFEISEAWSILRKLSVL